MGWSRTTHSGRALTEKQDRFVRLVAQGVSNPANCGSVTPEPTTGSANRTLPLASTATRWR